MNKITIEDLVSIVRTEICGCRTSGFNKQIFVVNHFVFNNMWFEVWNYGEMFGVEKFTLQDAIDTYNDIERRTDVFDQR